MRDPCRLRHRGWRMAASRLDRRLGEASTDAASPNPTAGERLAADRGTMGRIG